MTSATPPEEIERQHQAAIKVAQQPPIYAKPPLLVEEIPLRCKVKRKAPIDNVPPNANDDMNDTDAGPCWSSRGHVDVSEIAEFLREGYDDINKPPPTASSSSSSSGEDEKKSSDEYATTSVSPTNLWNASNASKYNVSVRRPSHDAWGIGKVMLVFADDFLQTTYEFPYYTKFRKALKPILEVLQIQEFQIVRLLFASLPPGVTIPVHQDSGMWVRQTHRVHVPILVNDPSRVVFTCGHAIEFMQRIHCQPGHVFEINNQSYHAVSNCDEKHRVHMILDYMDATATLPQRILLKPHQVLLQTRRSIDLLERKGQRPTPSFIILGAQKAGTTSLFEYLMQHPLIVSPKRRETHLFDWRWISEVTKIKQPTLAQKQTWMHKFFHHAELERHASCMTGDSTPSYLLDSRRVIPRLRETITWPLKFFVMLRHPIKRAESHYAMVTSTQGTEAQLHARGTEWRDKSFAQVVREELLRMKEIGLIPYFDIENGLVDESIYNDFAYTQEETAAWDRYLKNIPLNTGSHSLLGRGMYELNLRSWMNTFPRDQFMVIQLERMTTNVHDTLDAVWKHLQIPAYDIEDVAPKNQRSYDRIANADMEAYLTRFYAPHNRRLRKLLGEEWNGVWEM
ncbi:hypothetical protein MPSEU_000987300 [Mayamaea pseudoterrestris]|nr:hypothetical protein MPSEU_000987300 [Mayamaea pseudoterrestris]